MNSSFLQHYQRDEKMTVRIPFPQVPKDLMAAMMQVENYVNACGFSARLLELLRLRASQINGCAYCIDMHYKEAIAAGEEPLRLYSLSVWRDTDFYAAKEQAALAWCETITSIHDSNPIDDLFTEMQRHFKDTEIAHLTLAITQINSWTRLVKSFGFPPGHYQVGGH
jgi:AhpD family alkylhydroperoxidase